VLLSFRIKHHVLSYLFVELCACSVLYCLPCDRDFGTSSFLCLYSHSHSLNNHHSRLWHDLSY